MGSEAKIFEHEAEQLYKSLFGKPCPSSLRDLYVAANTELEPTWSFDFQEKRWLSKVLKVNLCLPELAWLAKSHKSNRQDILWVKMHVVLYLSELSGFSWAQRNRSPVRVWIGFAFEVILKPIRLATGGLRLLINV
jgi:hypothetical protein